ERLHARLVRLDDLLEGDELDVDGDGTAGEGLDHAALLEERAREGAAQVDLRPLDPTPVIVVEELASSVSRRHPLAQVGPAFDAAEPELEIGPCPGRGPIAVVLRGEVAGLVRIVLAEERTTRECN